MCHVGWFNHIWHLKPHSAERYAMHYRSCSKLNACCLLFLGLRVNEYKSIEMTQTLEHSHIIHIGRFLFAILLLLILISFFFNIAFGVIFMYIYILMYTFQCQNSFAISISTADMFIEFIENVCK